MRFDLDSEYAIAADDLSVTLIKKFVVTGDNNRGKKPKAENIGVERERIVCYCPNVEQALRWYVDKKLNNNEGIEVAEVLLEAILECQETIKRVCKEWGLTRRALAEAQS